MNESYSFYADKLSGEYREVFRQIEMYINMNYIDDVTKEEYLSKLLDIFQTGQSKGKPVQKITGKNIERFCETFCPNYGLKNRVLNFLDRIKGLVWIMFFITLTDILFMIFAYAAGIQIDFWNSSDIINLPLLLIGVFIVSLFCDYVIYFIARHIMFRTKHISMSVLQSVHVFVIIIAMILTTIIMENNDNMWIIPSWILMLICVVYLVLYYAFNFRRLRENKISFKDRVTGAVKDCWIRGSK